MLHICHKKTKLSDVKYFIDNSGFFKTCLLVIMDSEAPINTNQQHYGSDNGLHIYLQRATSQNNGYQLGQVWQEKTCIPSTQNPHLLQDSLKDKHGLAKHSTGTKKLLSATYTKQSVLYSVLIFDQAISSYSNISELCHQKMCLSKYAANKGSNQQANLHGLIKAVAVCMKYLSIPIYTEGKV